MNTIKNHARGIDLADVGKYGKIETQIILQLRRHPPEVRCL